ncbi:MAG TPA: DUF2520 domain-containing protein [Flavitalea sp.]|nr:DUF2520 domain-containing protein [Flavitalea sp.]
MRIVIIGTGNTATVLGRLFHGAGHTILQVVGRTSTHLKQLGNILRSTITSNPKELNTEGDLYIIAVSDNAISQVASWLRVDKKLVVHTAGSVDIEIISGCSKNYGVLYPLQSLRKEMDELPHVPFLVEGNTKDDGALIHDLASTISGNVKFATGHQRLMTHIAAIMVSNFTNHLYGIAEDFCDKENVDFKMLQPLILETAARVQKFSALEMQTGPASRNDTTTIKKHVQLLEKYPVQKSIYEFLTESILAHLSKKK